MASGSGAYPTNITNQEGPSLHGPFPYISLVFKLTSTLIIISMASLVCVTIKKTKRLHRPHNILVANVMIADVMLALWSLIPASIMYIAFAAGTENFINCSLLNFTYHPVIAYHTTFIMISIDKVVAIGFPFKYKRIMNQHVVTGMICISWLLALAISVHILFTKSGHEVPEYGVCLSEGIDFLKAILTYAIPIFMEAVITTLLNIYLAIKAYQVRKQVQKETRLSGATNQVEALQQKRRQIRKHMKPILTLLIILLGNSFITLAFIILYILGRVLLAGTVYDSIMEYVVKPNIIFLIPFFHPIVYGIHFKQIREPMMNMILRCYNRCTQNSAVP
ncbi:trace amine-associated receptor 8a-like [Dysidea avara]|uniref:trace amine-associated receptor 8a-like n=1 Tax=Dysidea avara TaxID=196820 RepID=UPI0033259B1B